MVKHVVMWRFTDKSDINVFREQLESMRDKVPTMLDIQTGVDFNKSVAAYDLILITSHKNTAALDAYQNDPLHLKVKAVLGKMDVERVVVDFEV